MTRRTRPKNSYPCTNRKSFTSPLIESLPSSDSRSRSTVSCPRCVQEATGNGRYTDQVKFARFQNISRVVGIRIAEYRLLRESCVAKDTQFALGIRENPGHFRRVFPTFSRIFGSRYISIGNRSANLSEFIFGRDPVRKSNGSTFPTRERDIYLTSSRAKKPFVSLVRD